MKLVSWNVNGLRACWGKGFEEVFRQMDADAFCLQETKMQPGQLEVALPGYHQFWNSAEKKGYSGTAIFTKQEPLSVSYGIGVDEFDHEGRVITLDMGKFTLLTVYTPNSQDGLKRLPFRLAWEDAFLAYIDRLRAVKPLIFCGDLNVAHQEIDIKNAAASFRYLHPDTAQVYSWWSYRFRAREHNAGWRIDYFIVSDDWKDRIVSADIHTDIFGSDHCPVELVIRTE